MVESTRRKRRTNGDGTLFEDKARGRWRGAVAWTDPDGTLQRRSFSGKTRSDVKARMDRLRSDLGQGRRPGPTVTVRAFLAGWLEAEKGRVRPSTWRYRETHVRIYIVPKMGDMKLSDLDPRHVEAMTSGMVERGLSPRSAVGARVTLRKALQDALRDGLVHRNVAALARPPRIPGKEVDFMTRDELRTLLDACRDHHVGPLVTLAALTGLRQGELLGLSWGDVDLDAGTLTVRRSMSRSWGATGWALAEPKTTRSRRTIHLPGRAVEALRAQRAHQEAAEVAAGSDVWQNVERLCFTDAIGRPLKGWNVSHDFHALLKRAGLRSVPFHALRHSWATLALANGVPLKTIADNLGHASIAITAAFYSGIVAEMSRDAADAVGRALEPLTS